MTRSHYAYTRRWLENCFSRTDVDGVFMGHMPIYGHRTDPAEPGRLPRLARALQILRMLDRTEFRTLLDVGCAEGYLPWVVRRVFGAEVIGCDLSVEACRRAGELFGVDAVACDAERLPFPDGAFDVVFSSETIEHVEYPVSVLLELSRVARRAVVLTTEEIGVDRDAIDVWLAQRCGYPHGERNRFHPDDLTAVFGPGVELWTQMTGSRPAEPMDDASARQWILDATPDRSGLRGTGVVAVCWLDPGARRDDPGHAKTVLCDALLASRVEPRPLTPLERAAPSKRVLRRLVCPIDRQPLAIDGGKLRSATGRTWTIADGGIPMLHARQVEPVPPPDIDGRIPDGPRRETVHALHERLFLPDTTGKSAWRFDDPADRIGWRTGGQLVARESEGPGWHLTSTGDDPDLVGPTMPFGTDEIAAFEIDMRVRNPAFGRDEGIGQIYWLCDVDVSFRESANVTFPVINDDDVHTYVVDPRDGCGWPRGGDLLCVRLDPVNGPCAIDLVGFRIRLRRGPRPDGCTAPDERLRSSPPLPPDSPRVPHHPLDSDRADRRCR